MAYKHPTRVRNLRGGNALVRRPDSPSRARFRFFARTPSHRLASSLFFNGSSFNEEPFTKRARDFIKFFRFAKFSWYVMARTNQWLT